MQQHIRHKKRTNWYSHTWAPLWYATAVDERIIDNVCKQSYSYEGSNGSTNGIIDTQSDVGGWPELASASAPTDTDGDGMPDDWETANGLDPSTANATGKNLSTAYDNIEVYLNSLVKSITVSQN